MKKQSLLLAGALCLLGLSAPTIAAPILYNEGASGDLSNTGSLPTALGVLDVGLNTVSGAITPEDHDSFTVEVPVGLEATSVNFFVSNFVLVDPDTHPDDEGGALLSLFDLTTPFDVNIRFTADGAYPFISMPVGTHNFRTFAAGPTGQVSFDYIYEILVDEAQVPEPMPLALLSLGLVGFGVIRKRVAA